MKGKARCPLCMFGLACICLCDVVFFSVFHEKVLNDKIDTSGCLHLQGDLGFPQVGSARQSAAEESKQKGEIINNEPVALVTRQQFVLPILHLFCGNSCGDNSSPLLSSVMSVLAARRRWISWRGAETRAALPPKTQVIHCERTTVGACRRWQMVFCPAACHLTLKGQPTDFVLHLNAWWP